MPAPARRPLADRRTAGEPLETRLARLFEGLSAEDFVTFTGQSWRDRLTGYYELMSNPKILDVPLRHADNCTVGTFGPFGAGEGSHNVALDA